MELYLLWLSLIFEVNYTLLQQYLINNTNPQNLFSTNNIETLPEKLRLRFLSDTLKQQAENIATSAISLEDAELQVDAIDNVTAKLELIKRAKEENIKIISSMGTGNKIYPEMLEIQDISKTSVCPLARVIRRELRNVGINHLTVVYSKEEPQNIDGERTPASSTFVPISAGVLIASKVVQDILEIK